jgi:hypothetical protein
MNQIEQLARALDLRYATAPKRQCGCAARHLAERMLESRGFEWESAGRGTPRNVLLLHGTTTAAANQIVGNQRFTPQRTFFGMDWKNRDLARIFAARAASRSPRDGTPALVAVSVPPDILEQLRRLGLFRLIPFDPGDRPELRNRTQWVLEPEGVRLLNWGAERIAAVPMGSSRARRP